MCGRYLLKRPAEEVASLFRATKRSDALRASYNVAPAQDVAAVLLEEPGKPRVLTTLRWGLVPHWAKESASGIRPINLRAETVASSPMSRDSFRKRRCLIPADGFYEWKGAKGAKTPYAIMRADRATFAFAGVWADWTDKESGASLRSCAIITTTPNEVCAPIHNRMPAILDEGDYAAWLGEAPASADALQALLRPFTAAAMIAFAIGKRVGNVRNDDPSLIEPLPAA